MEDKVFLIYKIVFPNDKVYIGQTKNLKRRISDHKYDSKSKSLRVYCAIRKYGWEKIRFEVIEENLPSMLEANTREIYWIETYKSRDPEFGYNMARGGVLSLPQTGSSNPMSLESIAKRNECSLDEARRLTPGYGREVSDFNRKRASETHKGKKLSQDIIDKLTEVNTKYIFKITNEVSGEIFEVENLKKWCEERNMSYGILYRRASKPEERTRRHYKEWSIVRMIK